VFWDSDAPTHVPLSRQAPSSRSRSKVGASVILPMRVSRLNASPVRGPDILTSGRARGKEVQEQVVGFGPSVDKILNTICTSGGE